MRRGKDTLHYINSPHRPAVIVFRMMSDSASILGVGRSTTSTLLGSTNATAFIVSGMEPIVMACRVGGFGGCSECVFVWAARCFGEGAYSIDASAYKLVQAARWYARLAHLAYAVGTAR